MKYSIQVVIRWKPEKSVLIAYRGQMTYYLCPTRKMAFNSAWISCILTAKSGVQWLTLIRQKQWLCRSIRSPMTISICSCLQLLSWLWYEDQVVMLLWILCCNDDVVLAQPTKFYFTVTVSIHIGEEVDVNFAELMPFYSLSDNNIENEFLTTKR